MDRNETINWVVDDFHRVDIKNLMKKKLIISLLDDKVILGKFKQVVDDFYKSDMEKKLIDSLLGDKVMPKDFGLIDVIVVFTGYGMEELADKAYKLWLKCGGSPKIFIVGPDNLANRLNKELTAEDYREFLLEKYPKINIDNIMIDYSKRSATAKGQSRVVAEMIRKEEKWKNVVLVTAGYHLPRAYMTLLKFLKKNGFSNEDVNLFAYSYIYNEEDWSLPDSELKEYRSWISGLRDEREKIDEYQKKGDVATWEELDEYLGGLKDLIKIK